jgi:hypothetical protein
MLPGLSVAESKNRSALCSGAFTPRRCHHSIGLVAADQVVCAGTWHNAHKLFDGALFR